MYTSSFGLVKGQTSILQASLDQNLQQRTTFRILVNLILYTYSSNTQLCQQLQIQHSFLVPVRISDPISSIFQNLEKTYALKHGASKGEEIECQKMIVEERYEVDKRFTIGECLNDLMKVEVIAAIKHQDNKHMLNNTDKNVVKRKKAAQPLLDLVGVQKRPKFSENDSICKKESMKESCFWSDSSTEAEFNEQAKLEGKITEVQWARPQTHKQKGKENKIAIKSKAKEEHKLRKTNQVLGSNSNDEFHSQDKDSQFTLLSKELTQIKNKKDSNTLKYSSQQVSGIHKSPSSKQVTPSPSSKEKKLKMLTPIKPSQVQSEVSTQDSTKSSQDSQPQPDKNEHFIKLLSDSFNNYSLEKAYESIGLATPKVSTSSPFNRALNFTKVALDAQKASPKKLWNEKGKLKLQ